MKRILVVFAVATLFLTSGCSLWNKMLEDAQVIPDTTSTEPELVQEDGPMDLRLAYSDFDTFNPLMTQNNDIKKAMEFVYDPLFTLDASLKPVGIIADSYECADTSLTIKLKEGVKWHDGSEVTANDVAYTINAIAGGKTSYWIDNLSGASVIDYYTVRANFSAPIINPAPLFTFPVVKSGTALTVDSSYEPMGSGRYSFDSKTGIDAYTFNQFDDIARVKGPFSHLILNRVPQVENTKKLFEAGSTDVYYAGFDELVNFKKGKGKLKANITDRLIYIGLNDSNPILSDVGTRVAINKIIDKNAIVNTLESKRATATDLPAHPWSWVYEGYNTNPCFNRVDAASIMSAQGWSVNDDGKYTRENNGSLQTISLSLLVDEDDSVLVEVANKLKADFEAFGFSLEIISLEPRLYESRKEEGSFDMYIGKCDIGKNMNLSYIFSGKVCTNYENDELFSLMWKIKEVTTSEEICASYGEFSDKFLEEMPFIPLYFKQEGIYVSPRIQAFINEV